MNAGAANIEVDYRFGPGIDAEKHAKVIAVGQTAGSWDERFAHRAERLSAHLAQVQSVSPEQDGAPGRATVSFPRHNVQNDIGSLLTMIFGKYSMAGAARVEAIRLPDDFGLRPRFGIDGIRRLVGAKGRPLVMAIFKPALGLTAEDHAEILGEVAQAGIDVIKDDEILGDLASAPTLERVKHCRRVIEQAEKDRGRTLLYAVNVTGRADQVLEQARALVGEGANALLVNVLTLGYSVLEALAADDRINVPLFAHPALAGALAAAPDHGIGYQPLLGTAMAHAGADAVLYPAHYGSLPFDPKVEAAIRDALRSRGVFPVPSAGIHPGVVPRALADYGDDVVLNAGSGVMDHPDGPAAGVQAFFEALERVAAGQSFDAASVAPGPLRSALDKWGS